MNVYQKGYLVTLCRRRSPDKMTVDLKEPGFRVKDEIFDGKKIQGSAIPKVRDSSLMHTSLKQKRPDRSEES